MTDRPRPDAPVTHRSPLEQAQRWHDTDHGDTLPEGVSSCWCCCELCDPTGEPPRPNPFWGAAWAWLEDQ